MDQTAPSSLLPTVVYSALPPIRSPRPARTPSQTQLQLLNHRYLVVTMPPRLPIPLNRSSPRHYLGLPQRHHNRNKPLPAYSGQRILPLRNRSNPEVSSKRSRKHRMPVPVVYGVVTLPVKRLRRELALQEACLATLQTPHSQQPTTILERIHLAKQLSNQNLVFCRLTFYSPIHNGH